MRRWDELPKGMQTDEVRPYYDALKKHEKELRIKRFFDIVGGGMLLFLLLPAFIVIAFLVASTSEGGIFYTQIRVSTYGRKFRIYKFRTMVKDADTIGSAVTTEGDERITPVGEFLRKYRLDELPQLVNIILGDMTFVGTRPEVVKYVKKYTKEMRATLLLPAGVTSEASVRYKDEAKLITGVDDSEVDRVYIEQILPEKMKINLDYIKGYSLYRDIKICLQTVMAVVRG